MTPRSYSRATFTAAKRNSSSRKAIAAMAISATTDHILSAAGGEAGVASGRGDPTMSSSVSGSTYSTSTCRPGSSGVSSALRACQSSPSTKTRLPLRTVAGLADEPVRSDRHRHAAHLRRLGQRQAEEQRERAGDRDRDRHRDLVGVAGRIEEHQRSDHEHDRARKRQRAVRDDERLGDEEAGREQHQQEPRRRDRQHLEAVEADDQRDRADRAREDEAGVPELDDDPDQPDREHQRDDVRVDQEIEQALPGREPDAVDLRLRRCRDRQPLAARSSSRRSGGRGPDSRPR